MVMGFFAIPKEFLVEVQIAMAVVDLKNS